MIPHLLNLLLACASVIAVPIDNGVEVEPQIVCGPGFIGVTFLLRNPFEGHIYVKNHYNETQCRSDQTGKRAASITVSFNTCGVQRTRSLNPKGVFVNTVIVISFHPKFITKVDRAYAFQCFYMESEKTVAAQLDISEITSVFQTQRVPMPVCRYEVLDSQPPNGQPIRYSIVGQQVFHRWTCDTETTNTFCMNVNSCFVYDGLGEQAQLLDGAGCAIDRYLLQNLEYTTDLMAVREAHVFKFADRAAVYFQCQIAITIKEPGQPCPRPSCPALPSSPSSAGGNGASGSRGGSSAGNIGGPREGGATQPPPGTGTTAPRGPGQEGGNGGGGGPGGGGGSREGTTAGGGHGGGGGGEGQTPGGEQRTTVPGSRRPEGTEGGRSAGGQSTTPITTAPAITVPANSGFRTTSNASYRAVTGGDDPLRIDDPEKLLAEPRRSINLRSRHRKQRSSQGVTLGVDRPSPGEELGIWDVRAPSIAVFDLDDSTALGLRGSRNRTSASNHEGLSERPQYPASVLFPSESSPGGVEHPDYCLTLHAFALLLALAITPSCALALGCFLRCMQRESRKLY